MPPATKKISAALLEFAQPLLHRLPADTDLQVMSAELRIAAMVWNAVVLETVGRPGVYVEEIRSRLRSTLRGGAKKEMLAMIAELEGRKRREDPMDLRLIGECECLVDKHGGIYVKASHSEPQVMSEGGKPNRDSGEFRKNASDNVDPLLQDFYETARDFYQLAPWRWMQNEDVFGVKDPDSGVVNWCSVMGAGCEQFGLALYLGPEGYDVLRRISTGDTLDDEGIYGQPALVLLFLDREELSKHDLRIIRLSGVKFRGRGAYPQFESHGENRLPCPPTEDELRTMTRALNEACSTAASGLTVKGRFAPDSQGRLLVRTARPKDPAAPWVDSRLEPPASLVRASPKIDADTILRLRRETKRVALEVECDLFPSKVIIKERGQPPYSPPVFMATDAGTGRVLCCELGEPEDRSVFAQAQFLELIEKLKARPSVVYLKRPSLLRVVEPLCKMLEMRVESVAHLNTLEPARESLERFSTRER